jgi:N-acetylmuramoyl-L-alanine amidase
MMRTIEKIIWHCSATKEGQDVRTDTIRKMHQQQRGWSDIGYHYVVELDGTVEQGRDLARPGAHTQGLNATSVGVCYVGGVDEQMRPKDTRNAAQRAALYDLTAYLIRRFPGATVHGHNEFAPKACPSFDVQADWRAYVLSLPIEPEVIAEEDEHQL